MVRVFLKALFWLFQIAGSAVGAVLCIADAVSAVLIGRIIKPGGASSSSSAFFVAPSLLPPSLVFLVSRLLVTLLLVVLLVVVLFGTGCRPKLYNTGTSQVLGESTPTVDSAPVASDFSSSIIEDVGTQLVELVYTDTDNDLASTCSVTAASGGTLGDCTCTALGVCSAEFIPTSGLSGVGAASFQFSVTANGSTSGFGTATLDVTDFCTGVTQQSTAPFAVSGVSPVPDGSATKPYRICTAAQLQTVQSTTSLWTKTYTLKNDIDLSTYSGIIGTNGTNFTGSFDGQNHTLSNFTYNNNGTQYVGLFGYVTAGTLKDVKLTSVSITGNDYVGSLAGYVGAGVTISNIFSSGSVNGTAASSDSIGGIVGQSLSDLASVASTASVTSTGIYIGGLVGSLTGAISNCSSTGTVTQNVSRATVWVGGIAGYIAGSISNCTYTGNITGIGSRVGGLVGEATTVTIQDSSFSGTISSATANVGGLVGQGATITIQDSHVSGTITNASNSRTGGLVGYSTGTLTILRSYNTATVSGIDYVAGIVGHVLGAGSSFTDTYNTGDLTATSNYIGGIVGRLGVSATFDNCYSNANLTQASGASLGGLIGNVDNGATISNSHSSGTYSGVSTAGGLVGGSSGNVPITNSYSSANITGANYLAGIAASITGDITSCYFTGTLTSTGTYVGGIGGTVNTTSPVTISNSYSTGTLSGTSYVGGLLGVTAAASPSITISNSYHTTGLVSSSGTSVGGLIGNPNSATTVSISNSYNTADVSGQGTVGGLVGLLSSTTTLTSSYSDANVTTTAGGYGGGLVGRVSTNAVVSVSSSYSKGTVTVTGGASGGGLIGSLEGNNTRLVDACSSTSTVNVSGSIAGGLIGYLSTTSTVTVQHSFATGNVTSAAGYAAGLIGNLDSSGVFSVSSSYATGDVTGTTYAGGLVGLTSTTATVNLTNVYATGNVNGGSGAGGLMGYWQGASGSCRLCAAFGNVAATANVGGLIGYFGTLSNITLEDVLAAGNVYGNSSGGITGILYQADLTRGVSLSNVSTDVAGSSNGGITYFGASGCTISDSYAIGNIRGVYRTGGIMGSGNACISQSFYSGAIDASSTISGGLLGGGSGSAGTITDSFSLGRLTSAQAQVGGVLGYTAVSSITLTRDYSLMNLSGLSAIGGSVGDIGGGATAATVDRNYYAGTITVSGTVGGIAGNKPGGGSYTYNACFWDNTLNPAINDTGYGGNVANVDAASTTAMKTAATFTAQGWDFVGESANGTNDYWVMPLGQDGQGYPRLTNSSAVYSKYNCYGAALTNAPFAAGSGTLASPYVICTATQYAALTQNSTYWDKNFLLGEDIDLSSAGTLNPIGDATTAFSGSFDGLFYKVKNITLNAASDDVGVFGRVAGDNGVDGVTDGEIRNLTVEGASVTGQANTAIAIGYLERGRLLRASVAGTVNGTSQVGGLIGTLGANARVMHVVSTANVNATADDTGGLVGKNEGILYFGVSKTGAVSAASSTGVGGLIGQNAGQVFDSYSRQNVTGTSSVGGLIGLQSSSSALTKHCYSSGAVAATSGGGGLIGLNSAGTVTESFWDVQTSGYGSDGSALGSDGGTGKSTANMQTQGTFTNFLFNRDWRYTAATYPGLFGE